MSDKVESALRYIEHCRVCRMGYGDGTGDDGEQWRRDLAPLKANMGTVENAALRFLARHFSDFTQDKEPTPAATPVDDQGVRTTDGDGDIPAGRR